METYSTHKKLNLLLCAMLIFMVLGLVIVSFDTFLFSAPMSCYSHENSYLDNYSAYLIFDEDDDSVILNWDSVQDADEYEIYINCVRFAKSFNTSFDVSNAFTYGGEYIFTINAKALHSTIAIIELQYTHFMQLKSPANLSVLQNTLSWSDVANATTYRVSANGITIAVTSELSLNIANILAAEQIYNFKVCAENPSNFYITSQESSLAYANVIVPLAPENLFVTYLGNTFIASWSPSQNAFCYTYFLQSKEDGESGVAPTMFTTSSTTLDMSKLLTGDGDYIFSVQSVSKTSESKFSIIAFNISQGEVTTFAKISGNDGSENHNLFDNLSSNGGVENHNLIVNLSSNSVVENHNLFDNLSSNGGVENHNLFDNIPSNDGIEVKK